MQNETLFLNFGDISIQYKPISVSNRESLLNGSYYELPWISRVIDSVLHGGDVAVDVGAHTGLWSLPMARRVGESGRVYAFEPERLAINALLDNARLNSLFNVIANPLALASVAGRRQFFVRPDTEMHSFYAHTVRPYEDFLTEAVEVETGTAGRVGGCRNCGATPIRKDRRRRSRSGGTWEGFQGISTGIAAILVEIHEGPLASQGRSEMQVRTCSRGTGASAYSTTRQDPPVGLSRRKVFSRSSLEAMRCGEGR